MTPNLNQGYPRVTMRRNGRTFYRLCHQLVMETFVGPCPDGCEVRHKDGNRGDARLSNLEYGTRADNIADAKRHGTWKNGSSHLTAAIVTEIAGCIRADDSPANLLCLASRYNTSQATIYSIRAKKLWKHLRLDLPTVNGRRFRSKLTPDDVREISSRHSEPAAALAAEFGVGKDTISSIRTGRSWKRLGLPLRRALRQRGTQKRGRGSQQRVPDLKP
jgi:hypothetical protein